MTEPPKRSRKERRLARTVNDPKRIKRENQQRAEARQEQTQEMDENGDRK